MINIHVYGRGIDQKKLITTMANCLICRQYSACNIMWQKEYRHVFYFPIKTLDERYLFDWKSCGHRAILFEAEHVRRYREEQVESKIFSMPSYIGMNLIRTTTPKKITLYEIILILIGTIVFVLIVEYIKNLFGVSFTP